MYVLPPSISVKEKERLEQVRNNFFFFFFLSDFKTGNNMVCLLFIQECCQFQIDEIFKVPDIGTIVGGVLAQGVINIGTELVIGILFYLYVFKNGWLRFCFISRSV